MKNLYYVTMFYHNEYSGNFHSFELEFDEITKDNFEDFKLTCERKTYEEKKYDLNSQLISFSIVQKEEDIDEIIKQKNNEVERLRLIQILKSRAYKIRDLSLEIDDLKKQIESNKGKINWDIHLVEDK